MKVLELYGVSTRSTAALDWQAILVQEACPYLGRKCLKARKSEPTVTIGTCAVLHGRGRHNVIICPHRLLERNQVFIDCIHLLTLHEPGNELHIVPEITIPGGSVDYFLVSAREGKVMDFVGIELQGLDTTGTVWPERQRFLQARGIKIDETGVDFSKRFGMNWKMTAKTTLMQLHHEIETFEFVGKHLVLVTQDCLLDYMRRAFQFEHLNDARLGDPIHIHAYRMGQKGGDSLRLNLCSRLSTDTHGIAKSLGLQVSPKVELEEILALLESKITGDTLLALR